jgi:hypothetical protein
VQENDFNDDFATNHVICNLRSLGEELGNGGSFILSQLNFGDFFNEPASDLDTVLTKYSDGEADIILFHRYYGILIGKLKALIK